MARCCQWASLCGVCVAVGLRARGEVVGSGEQVATMATRAAERPKRGTETVDVSPTRGSARYCTAAVLGCRGNKDWRPCSLLCWGSWCWRGGGGGGRRREREDGGVELLSSGMWGISGAWYLGGLLGCCDGWQPGAGVTGMTNAAAHGPNSKGTTPQAPLGCETPLNSEGWPRQAHQQRLGLPGSKAHGSQLCAAHCNRSQGVCTEPSAGAACRHTAH